MPAENKVVELPAAEILAEIRAMRVKLDSLEIALQGNLLSDEAATRERAIRLIIQSVASQFGFPVESLINRCRTDDLAWARHVAMYFIFKLTDLSMHAIGRAFHRDHGTVIHAVRHVTDICSVDPHAEREVLSLEHALSSAIKIPRRDKRNNRTKRVLKLCATPCS